MVEKDKFILESNENNKKKNCRGTCIILLVVFLLLLCVVVVVLGVYVNKYKGASLKGDVDHTTTNPMIGSTHVPTTNTLPISTGNEPYLNVRLPTNIFPDDYNVYLDVDLITHLVKGHCFVNVTINEATQFIIIHAHQYDNLTGTLFRGSKELVPKIGFIYVKNQYHVMVFENDLEPGEYSLRYDFEYKLRDNLKGFYRASYRNAAQQEIPLAATQFQPVDARTAFPCFDEPALKAKFQITIAHSKNMIAISNMPVLKQVDAEKDKKKTTFETTPTMPTYLVAFAVCDFEKREIISNSTTNHVSMAFYAPAHQIDQLDFAMEVGASVLPYFERYYNLSYPLPKADMIALPDFAAGAMENWGLITYRLKGLLYNPEKSSLANKVYIAAIITHELAHQWFGNIVTMEWWSDLWLNEGFASYLEFSGVNNSYPDWDFTDTQVTSDRASALKLDALVKSHPISIEVKHPDEIGEIFDAISYQKGGYILRMLDHFIGQDIFRKGLNQYLKDHAFGNAKTEDLWNSLSKASGGKFNVSKIMNTWTLQMGFPVVTVNKKALGVFDLTQKRFYADRNPDMSKSLFNSTYNYKWIIPFEYVIYEKTLTGWIKLGENTTWLQMVDGILNVSKKSNIFVKGNSLQNGFYRVNYDAEGWNHTIDIFRNNHQLFDVKDRAGIISDVFAFADSGLIEYSTALDVLDYVDKDDDYIPWRATLSSITKLRLLTPGSSAKKLFKKFMLSKINRLYDKYGFNDSITDHIERKMQVLVVKTACGNGNKKCLESTSKMFADWMGNPTLKPVPADFKNVVFYYGIKHGGPKEWDFMFDQYLNTDIATDKSKYLFALSASEREWLIVRYLNRAMNTTLVKSQDFSSVISDVSANHKYLAYTFVKENWNEISQRFSRSFFTLRRIFDAVGRRFSTEYELEQLMKFVQSLKDTGTAKRVIEQTKEKVCANIEWRKYNEKQVGEWLAGHVTNE